MTNIWKNERAVRVTLQVLARGRAFGGARRPRFGSWALNALLVLILALAGAASTCTSARAADRIVTRLDDTYNNYEGTLRWAVDNANDGDHIYFDINAPKPWTIRLIRTLDIRDSIVIQGPNTRELFISGLNPDGQSQCRPFYLDYGRNTTISHLTITQGWATPVYQSRATASYNLGGGIYNDGNLTLHSVSITDCRAQGNGPKGGAIWNSDTGDLKVINSTLSGNSTEGDGGAIANYGGAVTVVNSTIAGNSAHVGGGIWSESQPKSIFPIEFEWTYDPGELRLFSSTVASNSAAYAGGISAIGYRSKGANNYGVSLSFQKTQHTFASFNSIIAYNTGIYPDVDGWMQYGDYNIITNGKVNDNGSTNNFHYTAGLDITSNPGDNQHKHERIGVDPKLDGSLQPNGGETDTYKLRRGPAIDGGRMVNDNTYQDAWKQIDQRGVSRILDTPLVNTIFSDGTSSDGMDVGAVEMQVSEIPNSPPSDIFLSPATVVERAEPGTIVGRLSAVDPDFGDTMSEVQMVKRDDGRFFHLGADIRVTSMSIPPNEVAGTRTIRVRATDMLGASFEKDIVITVTDTNDPPTFTYPGTQTINQDTSLDFKASIGNGVSMYDYDGNDAPDYETTVSVSSGTVTFTRDPQYWSTSLVQGMGTARMTTSRAPNFLGGAGEARFQLWDTLRFTPAPGFSGPVTMTLYANDKGYSGLQSATGGFDISQPKSDTKTILINVLPINVAPTLDDIANRAQKIDEGTDIVPISGISAGAGDGGQSLTVTASSSNTAVIPTPIVGYTSPNASGNVTFTPIAVGTAVITVRVTDSGGANTPSVNTTARSFTVTVTPSNIAPVLSNIESQPAVRYANVLTPKISGSITVSDADSATLDNATVRIIESASGFPLGEDVLNFTAQNGITGTYTAINGTLSLSGSATPAQYQAALRSVTYSNSSSTPNTARRTISFRVSEFTGTNSQSNVLSRALDFSSNSQSELMLVPGPQQVYENSFLPFPGNIRGLNYDELAGPRELWTYPYPLLDMSFSVPSGTITVGLNRQEWYSPPVDGNGTGLVRFRGQNSYRNNNSLNKYMLNGMTYTPPPNFNGKVTLTIATYDANAPSGSVVDLDYIEITVLPINHAPRWTKGADQFAEAGFRSHSIPNWATGIDSGVLDENQSLLFAITGNTNPALFYAGGPHIDINGTLSFLPAPGATGTATITAQLKDSGGTANGGVDTSPPQSFTITVGPLNAAPVNTVPGAQSTLEDTALVFDALSGNRISVLDTDAGEGAVTISLGVSSGTLSLSRTAGLAFTSGDGTADASMTFSGTIGVLNEALDGLTFQPGANASGTSTLTLTTNDNGNTGFGGAKSDVDTVSIAVSAMDDAPTLAAIADLALDEDAGPQSVSLSGIGPGGGADEASQTLSVTAISSDPALIPAPTVSYVGPATAGTLSFTPYANASGTAIITVLVTDSGRGTAPHANTFTRTFRVVISPVNDAPVAANAIASTPLGTARSITLSASDVEGDTLSFRIVAQPSHGSLSAVNGNQVTYTPVGGYTGSDSFTFKASDGSADSNVATVSLQVLEAPSLVVTTSGDTSANEGQVTLREAIAYASTLAGSPAITFAPGVSGTITLNSQLQIGHDMTITGPGARLLTVSGNNRMRIASVGAGQSVSLSGLTIANGRLSADGQSGAGILNAGTLSVTACAFVGNRVQGIADGGAIYNDGGTLSVVGCTFEGNFALYGGGALRNNSGTTSVLNSTFSGNTAGSGGAVQLINGSMTVRFCTLSGNASSNSEGGGAHSQNGNPLRISNSIIAGNTGGETSGAIANDGFNVLSGDPKLGPLQNNGGPTQTFALLAGSPAIDAGSTTLATDQRGVSRPQGSAPDIGAFELVTAPVATSGAVISEFRLRGPNGASDEYIELLNTTEGALNISGWSIDFTGTASPILLPGGAFIPARGHYLLANPGAGAGTGYSLGSLSAPDQTLSIDIGDASTLTLSNGSGVAQDTASSGASGTAPSGNGQFAFVRALGAKANSAFTLVSTNGNSFGSSLTAILGAPGPQNRLSPVAAPASLISTTLFDLGTSASVRPNRDRRLRFSGSPALGTGAGKGTLLLRRTITNNSTTQSISSLRFRLNSITTLNSPGYNPSGPQADLRLLSSGKQTVVRTSTGQTVEVFGTAVEAPDQPVGGGQNASGSENPAAATGTSVGVPTASGSTGTLQLGTPLGPGQSRSYNFLLGVETDGNFSVSLDLEAILQ